MNLVMENVTVSYGDIRVLSDVSHTFKEGKITILLGPNGCGKSTFIKAIVRKYAKTGALSYIPQEMYGQIGLTVEDTVALGRYDPKKFISGETEEDIKYIDDALSSMELADKRYLIYDDLSGGEKQRAMAARAICQDAPWFIMDEPSSNLDIVHSKHIMDTAVNLVSQKGKSFIIVMHNINDAVRYGDEFVLMRDGRIIKVCDKLDSDSLKTVFSTDFESVRTSSGRELFFAG